MTMRAVPRRLYELMDVLARSVRAVAAGACVALTAGAPAAASVPPGDAQIVELIVHRASGVTSAWLGNGVLVHHRQMNQQPGRAFLVVTVAASQAGPVAADPGIAALSQGAIVAWRDLAVRSVEGRGLRADVEAHGLHVEAWGAPDALTFSVGGKAGAMGVALHAARQALTEPRVDPARFEAWKRQTEKTYAERTCDPKGLVSRALTRAVFCAGGPQPPVLDADGIRAADAGAAQAWLDAVIARAPVEAAIVGDLPLDRALEMARETLGGLARRERIVSAACMKNEGPVRPRGPVAVEHAAPLDDGRARVLVGYFGADICDMHDHRALLLATKVLAARVEEALREGGPEAEEVSVWSIPGVVYSGFGLVMASATVDPADAHAAATAMREAMRATTERGPATDEFAAAAAALTETAAKLTADPEYWASVLATSTYRGVAPDTLADAVRAYGAMTAAQVAQVLRAYDRPEHAITLIVRPDGDGGAARAHEQPAPAEIGGQ